MNEQVTSKLSLPNFYWCTLFKTSNVQRVINEEKLICSSIALKLSSKFFLSFYPCLPIRVEVDLCELIPYTREQKKLKCAASIHKSSASYFPLSWGLCSLFSRVNLFLKLIKNWNTIHMKWSCFKFKLDIGKSLINVWKGNFTLQRR